MMNETQTVGFEYTIEVLDKDGNVTDREVVHNIMPLEGIHHVLNTVLKGGAQVAQWHIGLYETAYTPTPNDIMATFPTQAVETTEYASATRMTFTPGTLAAGSVDNSANAVEFEFTAAKLIYGGFISSSSAKGSTSGVLLSAVRFGSPKSVDSSSTLRVTAGFTMASL